MSRVSPDEPADVIGNLPRTRPSRRSPRRAARATTGEAAAPAPTPSAPSSPPAAKAKPKPKAKAGAAAKPKAAAKAKPKAKPAAAKAKAAPATGKVRGVTKTAAGRKVAERTETDRRARAKARADAAPTAAKPPIPPAGYAVPGAKPGDGGGLNLAEAVRTAGQLAELGVGALRGLLGR